LLSFALHSLPLTDPFPRGRGSLSLEQHGLDERLDLVARALEGPHLLLELDEEMRDPRPLQPLLHQHVVEQGGLAELGGHEDDRVGPGPPHLLDQALGPVLATLVPGRRRDRLVHVGRAQSLERIAVARHVRREPAPAEQQVVLDHVAARLLQDLQQPERRLLAEGAFHHHPEPVAGPAFAARKAVQERRARRCLLPAASGGGPEHA
jgi:hypothetical protein